MFHRPKIPSSSLFIFLFLLATSFLHSETLDEVGSAQRKAILHRLESLAQLPATEWRFRAGDIPDGQSTALDDLNWEKVQSGFQWKSGTAWFRRWIEIPPSLNGYDLRAAKLSLEVSVSGRDFVTLIVYVNGDRVASGEDLEPLLLVNNAQPGRKLLVAIKVLSAPEQNSFRFARIQVEAAANRPDPRTILQELQSSELLVAALSEDKSTREKQLDSAVSVIDFGALERGDQQVFDESLRQAQKKLEALNAAFKNYAIRATGNSHIDMAWLWPWSETVEVVRNTFRTSLQLMNEYPDYTFTQSSAQADAWLEEKYPQLFEEIKKRVQEGRWELVGGMWVEPDLNMPDGESIVRQLLVGKRYFREKFRKDIRIGWNPDSFGYNWQLPQIYKKSGVDYFVTQKIGWNDTTKFPYKLFWWQSPDGSRVLTYFPHDYANDINPVRMAGDLADYASRIKDFDELMHLYGVGDHGGGPTRAMLETERKWAGPGMVYPKLFLGAAQGFFEQLGKKAPHMNLPVWNSELYLQYHRGVYTTQAATKRNNRRSEELLLNAEKFSSLAWLFEREYPSKTLEEAWKKVLFNQFHDVAAGSGIAAIYRDAERDYAEVRHIGNEILSDSIQELSGHVNTQSPGVPLLVWNPLAWARSDVVETEVQLARPSVAFEIRDANGKPVLAEVVERRPENRFRVIFFADSVPSLGYKLFHAVAVARAGSVRSPLAASEDALENEFLRIQVDRKTGCITSIFEKIQGYEALAPSACGNLLQAFHDKPERWDAWNIDADFEKQKWDLTEAQEVRLVQRGPVKAVLRVTKKFQSSTFVQDITLYSGVPRADVKMDADWREKHVLLKVAFPLAVHNEKATFEIPYGAIERPTTRRTPEEKAQFEVPALRWADLSDGRFGFSLLNDGKYGYDAKDNVLRLSLLRSPEWPDPHADEGEHHFTYSMYPHAGGWKEASTVRRGYELNHRMIVLPVQSHVGSLPPELSFVRLTPENVVLTAIKKAEDDDAVLFRFYEFSGSEGDVSLKLAGKGDRAMETNLMEQPLQELPVRGNEVTVHTQPYEIKSVKVFFDRSKAMPVATKSLVNARKLGKPRE